MDRKTLTGAILAAAVGAMFLTSPYSRRTRRAAQARPASNV